MASDDLFGTWIPAIWTKARPEGKPPMFMIRRFLSSERDLAEAARVLMTELADPETEFRVWQGLLPRARSAPRLSYPAPTRSAKETALVGRIMAVEAMSRRAAEEAVDMLTKLGTISDAYAWFGVEEKHE